MSKRIVFMGASGVGGYVGGHLACTGQDVTLIDPWPDYVNDNRTQSEQYRLFVVQPICALERGDPAQAGAVQQAQRPTSKLLAARYQSFSPGAKHSRLV